MDPIIIWHNCLLIISHVLGQKLTVNRQTRGLSLTLSFVDLSQKCIFQRIWMSCYYWVVIWFKFLGTLSRMQKSPSYLKKQKKKRTIKIFMQILGFQKRFIRAKKRFLQKINILIMLAYKPVYNRVLLDIFITSCNWSGN